MPDAVVIASGPHAEIPGGPMKKCARCGADTVLFVNGIPLCVRCDTEIDEAQARKEAQGSKEAHPPQPAANPEAVNPEKAPSPDQGTDRRTTLVLYTDAVRRYQED